MAETNGIKQAKEELYGAFNERERRLFRFGEKAKYKALDIPEDDVNDIRVDKSSRGVGWKEITAIGGLLTAAVLGWKALGNLEKPEPKPAAPASGPVDSEYEVRFFDQNGNPINVPHISTKPK